MFDWVINMSLLFYFVEMPQYFHGLFALTQSNIPSCLEQGNFPRNPKLNITCIKYVLF